MLVNGALAMGAGNPPPGAGGAGRMPGEMPIDDMFNMMGVARPAGRERGPEGMNIVEMLMGVDPQAVAQGNVEEPVEPVEPLGDGVGDEDDEIEVEVDEDEEEEEEVAVSRSFLQSFVF